MSAAKIIRGLKEAVAHARGEKTGVFEHKVDIRQRFSFPRRAANYWLWWIWNYEEHALFYVPIWELDFPRRHLKESYWCFGPFRIRVRHN